MNSAETVANNLDLLTEILIRLPIKLLLTFKCVSKQWLSLISNPQFCISHTRHNYSQNPTPKALLLNRSYTPTPEFKTLPLEHEETVCKIPFLNYLNVNFIRILQSCNGLLFCSFIYTADDYDIKYFICNPTTNQFKKLTFPNRKFSNSVFLLSLAFDPLKSIHYKVIAFTCIKKPCQIFIFSSETNSWSPTEIIFNPPVGIGFYGGVFCNGAIHWDSEDVNSVYFDVDKECLNTMPMPPYSDGRDRKIQYFGESRGHLHLIVKNSNFTLEFNVLEMATDYSEWFVRYSVDLSALRIEFRELFWHDDEEYRHAVSALCVIRAEKEEESMVVVYLNGRAISYNFCDGTSKELCKLQSKSKVRVTRLDFTGRDAYQYFETLSCV